MVILKDVATPEICDWLIARARPRLKRAQVYGYDGKDAKMLFTEERTNSECVFGTQDRDLFIAILRTRIAEAVQIPARTMEPPEVLHYSVGQEFKRHYDSPSDPSAPGIPQRVITLLLSLNEDYEGGETEFLFQRRKVTPVAGTLLIAPAGFTHTHRGNTPLDRDKYIATSWFLFQRAEALYGRPSSQVSSSSAHSPVFNGNCTDGSRLPLPGT